MTRMSACIVCALVAGATSASFVPQPQAHGQAQSGVVMGRQVSPGPRPEGTGSIRGRVIENSEGRPLRGVRIGASWRGPSADEGAQFAARTDGDGVFTIDRLPDGSYFVSVSRRGFFDDPGGAPASRQVTIRNGAAIDIGDVRFVRGGVITGRVVDEHGEPVERARVTPVARLTGQGVLTTLGATSTTDDRGAYRLHGLSRGTYTVRVLPIGPSGRGPLRLQGAEPELLPAFAGSAGDLASADFVELQAGSEAVLDVRLPSGRLTTVSGQIVLAHDPATPSRPNVWLRPVDRGAQVRLANAAVQPDGRFEFLDVAPGRYLLVAEEDLVSTPQGPGRRRAGWVEIAVAGEALTEVAVPMGYGAMVRGRIEVDDGGYGELASRPLHVVASGFGDSHPVTGSPPRAAAVREFAFELRDVLGHAQLEVPLLTDGVWQKAVLIDGEDASDGFDFPPSGTIDGVVILVSTRQSGVSGRVLGARGDMQGVSVLALPEGRVDVSRGRHSRWHIVAASADGTFTADGLRPGRYTVVALSPAMRSVFDRMNREARQALVAANGRAVDVVEGRLTTVTPSLVER